MSKYDLLRKELAKFAIEEDRKRKLERVLEVLKSKPCLKEIDEELAELVESIKEAA